MRSCKNLSVAFLMVVVMGVAAKASADLVDSSTFMHKYEMDVSPATQDLDGNSVMDMNAFVAGSPVGSFAYADGILTVDSSGNGSNNSYAYFNNNYATTPDAIWQSKGPMIAGGWELEFSAKVVRDDGYMGTFYVAAAPRPNGQATDQTGISISGGNVYWGVVGLAAPVSLGSFDNTDALHAFRIVAAPGGGNGAYSVYRDGTLLAGGLNPCYAPDGGYTSILQWGDASSASHGVTAVDYLRFTGTVPEPGTLGLTATGVIGLLAYAWRRRK